MGNEKMESKNVLYPIKKEIFEKEDAALNRRDMTQHLSLFYLYR